MVEVGFVVHGHGEPVSAELGGFEQVELNFGRGVAGKAHLRCLIEHTLEHTAGVGGADFAVGGKHVTEHAGGIVFLSAPGQNLEGGGVRLQQHVGFVDAGETLNRGAVKAQALIEGAFYFSRCERNGFEGADHVGKPEADEADVALFDGAQYEFLLAVHELPSRCGRASAWYPSAGGGGALNFTAVVRKALHIPWDSRGSAGLRASGAGASLPRRMSCCYLAYRVLLCGGRVRGFVYVNSCSCATAAQILGDTRRGTPPLFLRCGFCSDTQHMTGSRDGERCRLAIMGVCHIPLFFPRLCSFRWRSFH